MPPEIVLHRKRGLLAVAVVVVGMGFMPACADDDDKTSDVSQTGGKGQGGVGGSSRGGTAGRIGDGGDAGEPGTSGSGGGAGRDSGGTSGRGGSSAGGGDQDGGEAQGGVGADGGADAGGEGGGAGDPDRVVYNPLLEDDMPPEQLAALDAAALIDIPAEEILLPDGITLAAWLSENQDFVSELRTLSPAVAPYQPSPSPPTRSSFISRFTACLHVMMDSGWSIADNGPNQPAQSRLAYVWGGKDPHVRGGGCSPNMNACGLRLHGLDCSGMVTFCANAAGAMFAACDTGTERLQHAATWTGRLPQSLKVAALAIDSTGASYEHGDVFVWRRVTECANDQACSGVRGQCVGQCTSDGRACRSDSGCDSGTCARRCSSGHTGVAVRAGNTFVIAQSNGSSSGSATECAANGGTNRGPREQSWDTMRTRYAPYTLFAFRILNKFETASVTVIGSAAEASVIGVEQRGPNQPQNRTVTCAYPQSLDDSGGGGGGGGAATDLICEADFETDTELWLSATPRADSRARFAGWSGRDCMNRGTTTPINLGRRFSGIECVATFDCPEGLTWHYSLQRCEDPSAVLVPLHMAVLLMQPVPQPPTFEMTGPGGVDIDAAATFVRTETETRRHEVYGGVCLGNGGATLTFDRQIFESPYVIEHTGPLAWRGWGTEIYRTQCDNGASEVWGEFSAELLLEEAGPYRATLPPDFSARNVRIWDRNGTEVYVELSGSFGRDIAFIGVVP